MVNNCRPTWAEIDGKAIQHNIANIKRLGIKKFMAVVKANAYGHGIIEVSKICAAEQVDYLGVASLDEAILIRESGVEMPILVLGYTPVQFAETTVAYGIAVTVFELGLAKALSEAAQKLFKQAVVHVKIDTGMGRLGFHCGADTVNLIKAIADLPGLNLEGIFTHFAMADNTDKSFTKAQINVFSRLLSDLKQQGLNFSLQHCANSAALMEMPESHFNMVRAGLALYGLYPDQIDRNKLDLIPAMELKSRISSLKWMPPGTAISYGCTYICQKETLVAVVPIGYADGYNRLLSNRSWAIIHGYQAPVLGTICMDQCMFDVTSIPDLQVGDEVLLFGKSQHGVSADDLAAIIGTINYEIVCMVSSRVPRLYI